MKASAKSFASFGTQDPGGRIYRREGSAVEAALWIDDVFGVSGHCLPPGEAAVYCGVSRVALHKRIRHARLTLLLFQIHSPDDTPGRRISPLALIPLSELRTWRAELLARQARRHG